MASFCLFPLVYTTKNTRLPIKKTSHPCGQLKNGTFRRCTFRWEPSQISLPSNLDDVHHFGSPMNIRTHITNAEQGMIPRTNSDA